MSERKLACVKKITAIEPIQNKDRIVLATIEDGWKVIVAKDEFKVNDLCVYIEVDSVLDPNNPVFEQARKRSNRIRTLKLGNVYSQGIAYPLSILGKGDWKQGDDVTEKLHITKYDEYGDNTNSVKVSNISKKKYNKLQILWFKLFGFPQRKKGGFSSLISKTDEERIQNCAYVLQNKEPVSVSQKIDGTSCSITLERTFFGSKFNVYSRNLRIGKDESAYWRIANMYDLEDRMSLMMEELDVPWIALQGEIAGPGIQKNPLKLKDIDFFVFNVITPNGRFGNKEMVEICYRYGLTTVPIMSYDYILPDTVDEILKYATGPSLINPDVLREGIVVRSQDGKHSFKAVSPEYLIRHDK